MKNGPMQFFRWKERGVHDAPEPCQRLGYLTHLDLGSGKHECTDHIYIFNMS